MFSVSNKNLKTIFGSTVIAVSLVLFMSSCGRSIVIFREKSKDNVWAAEIVAMKQFLGVYNAELRLLKNNEIVSNKLLFGGRDTLWDMTNEVRRLEFSDDGVTVFTRGSYGPLEVKLLLAPNSKK